MLAREPIPETDEAVIAAHRELRAGGGEGSSAHGQGGILVEWVNFSPAFGVPHTHNTAMRRGRDGLTIMCPGDSLNGSCMAGKDGLRLVQRRLPDDGALIQRTRHHL